MRRRGSWMISWSCSTVPGSAQVIGTTPRKLGTRPVRPGPTTKASAARCLVQGWRRFRTARRYVLVRSVIRALLPPGDRRRTGVNRPPRPSATMQALKSGQNLAGWATAGRSSISPGASPGRADHPGQQLLSSQPMKRWSDQTNDSPSAVMLRRVRSLLTRTAAAEHHRGLPPGAPSTISDVKQSDAKRWVWIQQYIYNADYIVSDVERVPSIFDNTSRTISNR
jgi:hypothetical protein